MGIVTGPASGDGGIVTVVGNPRAGSRTLTAAVALAGALQQTLAARAGAGEPLAPGPVFDLAELAPGLLAPWSLSTAAAQAAAAVRSARLVVLATPTYKGSYSGILKLLLDVIPAGGLDGVVVQPLTVAGGAEHRTLADAALRPVLAELGASVPVPALLLQESDLPAVERVAAEHAARHSAVLSAVIGALAGPPLR